MLEILKNTYKHSWKLKKTIQRGNVLQISKQKSAMFMYANNELEKKKLQRLPSSKTSDA